MAKVGMNFSGATLATGAAWAGLQHSTTRSARGSGKRSAGMAGLLCWFKG